MSRHFVILGPAVVVPAAVAAEIGPLLANYAEQAKRDGRQLDETTVAAIGDLDSLGRAWSNGWRGEQVPQSSAEVPDVDRSGSEPVEWISVEEAAQQMGITDRAVRKRLATGTLRGRKEHGSWRVDARTVEKIKERAA